jgi:hypothetical protein
MIASISSSESCCMSNWVSMVWCCVGVEAWCFKQKCSMQAPPLGLSVGLLGLWLLFRGLWMVAGVVFVVCVWLGWLFGRWLGLALQVLGMNLRSEAPFRISFWVAFCGCSFELINGGRHCWVSTAGGCRAPTRVKRK